MLDNLWSDLVSVGDAAFSASGSFAWCATALHALSDYPLPEFPLRYHVEIQAALTLLVTEAALSVDPY